MQLFYDFSPFLKGSSHYPISGGGASCGIFAVRGLAISLRGTFSKRYGIIAPRGGLAHAHTEG